jgi:outer membrane protein TolC
MQKLVIVTIHLFIAVSVVGCNKIDFANLAKNPFGSLKSDKNVVAPQVVSEFKSGTDLGDIISGATPNVSFDEGFANSVRLAVMSDPRIVSARQDYEAKLESIKIIKGEKDFQLSGTVYGGVEDVTDETTGLAFVLNARRIIYDGGILDNAISAEHYASKALYEILNVKMNESALESATAWVELERYLLLNALISSRLEVLDPLISQLEKVAQAGVGDKTQVAAAQRTVMMIRVTQSTVSERLELAKVNFINMFGSLPANVTFDSELISSAVPVKLSESLVLGSPALVGGYHGYNAAIASLASVQAKADFSVGFETKVQRPFGGSSYDSDESVGLVVRKTFYDGKSLDRRVESARIGVRSSVAKLQATYREGRRSVENAQQTIAALDNAIAIAKENAKASIEEISLLRKQLIIGQSTLDSVLAAEARLYDAQSKEIEFLSQQRFAELTILANLGLFAPLIGLE